MKTNLDLIQHIFFNELPALDSSIVIDNTVIMYDNLESDTRIRPENRRKTGPAKMMMAFCYICLEGEIHVKVNNVDFDLTKSSGMICMPGNIIEEFSTSPDCKAIAGAIELKSFGKRSMQSGEIVRKWLLHNNGFGKIDYPQDVCDTFVESYRLFKSIICKLRSKYVLDAAIGFFHTVSAIFASYMEDSLKKEEPVNISKKKEIMLKFLSDVHEFCASERAVAFYAERCCLSSKYFARTINESLGMKPGDVIKAHVILEAKVLLSRDDLSVQQISEMLHFANASFFCKYFRAATGCTPKQYQMYGEDAVKKS